MAQHKRHPRDPARQTPLEQARAWWGSQVKAARYVVRPGDAPSRAVARVLRQEGLVLEAAGGRVWVLVPPGAVDHHAVFLANYWPIVALVLEDYAPAAVVGVDAVRLHLDEAGIPAELRAYHAANRSVHSLQLWEGSVLRLRPGVLTGRVIEHRSVGHATIPVLSAADVLPTLDAPEIGRAPDQVGAWLRHLVLRTPALVAAITASPRSQVLQRLADMARQVGNASLAKQLDQGARNISPKIHSPARTGTRAGAPFALGTALGGQLRGTGSPWRDEQTLRLERHGARIAAAVPAEQGTPGMLRALVAHARKAKAYDAYHNTTMEGYRISPETVDAIVRGTPLPGGPQSEEEVQAAMAVQGYAQAFDEILRLAPSRPPITQAVILDLYEALFRPSVDAGIVEPGALRGWRTGAVALRGWRHVPPNPAKVRDLMGGLEAFAQRHDPAPAVRAFTLHLEFVTVHPFLDGNGRLGRLVMNLALLSGGLPWITIPTEKRDEFFQSIERAQVDQDVAPYALFMQHALQVARESFEAYRKPRRQRR